MRSGIILLVFFFSGIAAGKLGVLPVSIIHGETEIYVLYILLFLVGISIGGDSQALNSLKKLNLPTLLVPMCIVIGSLTGAALAASLFSNVSLRDSMAVGAGFGYYSLSSVLITRLRGDELGVVALLANILREVSTLLFAPIYVRLFGKLAPVASGGATAMDVTLPVIQKYSGTHYAMVAVISGIVLSIIVPFLVSFILS